MCLLKEINIRLLRFCCYYELILKSHNLPVDIPYGGTLLLRVDEFRT